MYKTEPEKIDELERSVKDMRAKLEEAKRLRDMGPAEGAPATAAGIKKVVGEQTTALGDQLESLREQQAAIEAQADALKQLENCGDHASLVEFFEKQGLSHEQLQRGLAGDADAMFAELHEKERSKQSADEAKANDALKVAEQLQSVLSGGELPEVPAPPADDPPPVEPPKAPEAPEILMPDVFQRQPTATDKTLVVTVSLPGVKKGSTKLDISESQIRLFAPAPPRPDGRAAEYRLNAKLARRVLSDQAKAKWKSKAEQLVVTIPTLAGH